MAIIEGQHSSAETGGLKMDCESIVWELQKRSVSSQMCLIPEGSRIRHGT
jgi:hypothetical protein